MRRNPWMRVAATVSAMLCVLLLASGWRFLQSRGVFTSVEEKATGPCRAVPGTAAVADIAASSIVAYIASDDALYVYGNGNLARISGTPKNFHPAALSLDGNSNLRVLFRQGEEWKVSVFTIKLAEIVERHGDIRRGSEVIVTKPVPPHAEELGRLTTDELSDPADLVSVDDQRFYLVNRHTSHTALGRWLDDAFLLPRANVLYFDGMKFVTVAARLNSPAGLTLSKDGGHLYVAEDYPRTIAGFTRNDMMGSLDNASVLPISANPQNISVAPDGSLIVAARPKAGAGQVYRVTVVDGVPQKAELLYAHKGEEVAASAQLGSHLLIGTQSKLLDCSR